MPGAGRLEGDGKRLLMVMGFLEGGRVMEVLQNDDTDNRTTLHMQKSVISYTLKG